jgi:DNA-binding CsgD family transcriptional regulator
MTRRTGKALIKAQVKALELWGEGKTRREIGQVLEVSERMAGKYLDHWLRVKHFSSLQEAYIRLNYRGFFYDGGPNKVALGGLGF